MTQIQALELVLHWICEPDVTSGFWYKDQDIKDQIQSCARLQASCRMDVPLAKQFMTRCWKLSLKQYMILLRQLKDVDDCTLRWWLQEKDRVDLLLIQGPSYTLKTYQEVQQQYTSTHELLYEAGGGEFALRTYMEYLARRPLEPSIIRYRAAQREHVRFKQWVENVNSSHWIAVTTMLMLCPGLLAQGGRLAQLCKDHKAFEKAWFGAAQRMWTYPLPTRR